MGLRNRLLACNRDNFAWFKRHWRLSLHLWLAAGIAGFALACWSVHQSAPAQLAFEQARISPIAQRNLGTPMRKGLFVGGSVESLRTHQFADLRMPVFGPNGQGVLYANAFKVSGVWQLTTLDLSVEGRPGRLNLLPIQSTIPR
jgi:hypothetical protein